MEYTYLFGYPNVRRSIDISESLKDMQTGEKYQVNYRGKYRPLPVIEVPIELPVYRIENIRTKSLQKQWLALHKELPRDLFVNDPFSIESQEAQHQILKLLVDKENLFKTFKENDKLQQTDPLICSSDGIIVNGNRRLCAWRELYYNNRTKYAHFQTVRVAVLPDSDPQGMYDLEVSLQIHSDMKAEYVWHAIAADYQEKFDLGIDINVLADKQNKKPEEIHTYKVGLVNNGMFFMTAIIGAVCKMYYRPAIINQIVSSVLSEQKLEIISQHDIDHPIFRLEIEDYSKHFSLFEYCYAKFFRPGYEFLKAFKEKYNNYSNFTKVNNNYTTYVLKQIEFEYRAGIPTEALNLLDPILYQPSEADRQRNAVLLETYVNVICFDTSKDSTIPENISAQIKEALIAYRTKTYKLNRIKAYEVFRNVSCDRIAKFAPCSLEDLKALRCLDEAQFELYGQDIIDIVKQYVS